MFHSGVHSHFSFPLFSRVQDTLSLVSKTKEKWGNLSQSAPHLKGNGAKQSLFYDCRVKKSSGSKEIKRGGMKF
jgi:hypothetical protein